MPKIRFAASKMQTRTSSKYSTSFLVAGDMRHNPYLSRIDLAWRVKDPGQLNITSCVRSLTLHWAYLLSCNTLPSYP